MYVGREVGQQVVKTMAPLFAPAANFLEQRIQDTHRIVAPIARNRETCAAGAGAHGHSCLLYTSDAADE